MNDTPDSVTLIRTFDASPRDVFVAWTTPDSLRCWLADAAWADPRPGGRFRLEGRVPDGQVYVMSGEYREFVPDRRLVISWTVEGPGGAADRVETLVTVEFHRTGSGGTEIDFREEYVEEEYTVDPDAEAAWTEAFDGLESLLGAPAK